MADERVTIAIADGVADVRLARPDRMNACDRAMFDALADAIARLGGDRGVRAVVLSGEGRGFCAGIDLATLAGGEAMPPILPRTHGAANLVQHVAWGWRTLPQPVIAAIHGVAFGAGLQIALGADIRIAAPDARFAAMEARWGLVPDMAGTALMRGLVRDDHARAFTYTGEPIAAAEAQAIGLATRLCDDPRGEALALARTIAANSPDAMRAAKRLHNQARDGDAAGLLLAESEEQAALLASANHRETLAATAAKRPPRFED